MTIDRRLDILFKLLIIAILLSPFNYNVYSIRPLDIVLVIFILFAIPIINIKSNNFKISSLFFVIFTASIVMGALFSTNETHILRGIFIYKYLLPFLLIAVLYSMPFSSKQIDQLLKLLFYVYLFLVFWVFADMIDYRFIEQRTYIAHRPAFPFRDNSIEKLSDAHLYSTYLSIGLIFFIGVYDKLNISNYYKIPFIIISLLALAITGSKTGVLVLLIGLFLLLLKTKKKYIVYAGSGLVAFFALYYTFVKLDIINIKYMFVFKRIVDFSFLDNISRYSRIIKMNIGIEDAAIFDYLIGVGIFKSSLIWYDSLIGILFSHIGLIGILVFIFILFRLALNNGEYLNKDTMKYNYLFMVVLVCYFIANLITEFFLISRSMFPVALYLSILYHYQKLAYNKRLKSESLNHNSSLEQ